MANSGPLSANKLPKLQARRKTSLQEFLEYHIDQAPAIEVRKDYAEILGEFIVWLMMLLMGILTLDSEEKSKDKTTAKASRKADNSANDETRSQLFKTSPSFTPMAEAMQRQTPTTGKNSPPNQVPTAGLNLGPNNNQKPSFKRLS